MRRVRGCLYGVVLPLALTALTGCASFLGDHLGPASQFSQVPVPTPQPSIAVIISATSSINGSQKDVPGAMEKGWEKPTLRAYRDSGYFRSVDEGLKERDLRAEITIIDSGEMSRGGAFLTGLTFLLIPTVATDAFTIHATFDDRNGNELGTIEKTESIRTWIGLVFLPVMPFAWPSGRLKGALYDLNRAVLVDAARRGWLRSQEPAPVNGATGSKASPKQD